MFKKITILLTVFSVSVYAQSHYQTNNFTEWRVLDKNPDDKYIVVQAKDEKLLTRYRPICNNNDAWIFKYEMLGHDDAFYNAKSEPSDLKFLRNSTNYLLKIDLEEDNTYSGKAPSQKICSDNSSQRYYSNSNKHGLITYVGDKNIRPPF